MAKKNSRNASKKPTRQQLAAAKAWITRRANQAAAEKDARKRAAKRAAKKAAR